MSNALKIGIVGKRGLSFLPGLRSLAEVEVLALCEQNLQTLQTEADKHGIPERFVKYEAMLDRVDAVVVATPMPLHVPQSVLALGAGKHVLSEVTAAVSIDECWQLLDAVKFSGKTYFFAENYCFLEPNVLIGELVKKGLFGDLYFGEGEYLHEVRALHHDAEGNPTWRAKWQVGVNGCTYGTHSLGPVMQWFKSADKNERIASVSCFGTGQHTDPEHPHDDTTLMLCQLQSGKLIKIRLDMMSNRPHLPTYYALQGTKGAYEASRKDGQTGQLWLGENVSDDHRGWKPLSDFEEHLTPQWKERSLEAKRAGHGGGDYHVGREFVETILQGTPPTIDIYSALEWTAAGLCSQVSIAKGGVAVSPPDFRKSRSAAE